MSAWKCQRCGICCRATFHEVDGNLLGLYLEPAEVGLFPEGTVFPLFGSGDPIKTVAYQLGLDQCPNYEDAEGVASCRVYASRPLVCAAFPIIDGSRVSDGCPAVKQIQDGIDRESLKEELAVYGKKLDLMLDRPSIGYVWPLNKREWIRLR